MRCAVEKNNSQSWRPVVSTAVIERDENKFNEQETTIKNINNNFQKEEKEKNNPYSYNVIELKLFLLCGTNQIITNQTIQHKIQMEGKNGMSKASQQ